MNVKAIVSGWERSFTLGRLQRSSGTQSFKRDGFLIFVGVIYLGMSAFGEELCVKIAIFEGGSLWERFFSGAGGWKDRNDSKKKKKKKGISGESRGEICFPVGGYAGELFSNGKLRTKEKTR